MVFIANWLHILVMIAKSSKPDTPFIRYFFCGLPSDDIERLGQSLRSSHWGIETDVPSKASHVFSHK